MSAITSSARAAAAVTHLPARSMGAVALVACMAIVSGQALAEAPTAPPATTSRGGASVKQIFRSGTTATGQPIVLPQENAQVAVSRYEIPPGAVLPVHKHPFPRYAYVLAGNLRVTTGDGSRSFTYGPGDFVVEMLDAWHSGEAIGPETVKLLVIDQVEGNAGNVILKDHAEAPPRTRPSQAAAAQPPGTATPGASPATTTAQASATQVSAPAR